eukprot:1083403-Pleurochrysis_carterae.AAC.1
MFWAVADPSCTANMPVSKLVIQRLSRQLEIFSMLRNSVQMPAVLAVVEGSPVSTKLRVCACVRASERACAQSCAPLSSAAASR